MEIQRAENRQNDLEKEEQSESPSTRWNRNRILTLLSNHLEHAFTLQIQIYS